MPILPRMVLLPRMGVSIEPAMQNLSDSMRRAWHSFARSGSPDTPELPWPAYDSQSRTTMIFGADTLPENDPEREKRGRLFAP